MFKNRVGTVFVDAHKTSYEFSKRLKKGSKVLVPDGYDGWHVIPFTSYGHKVVTYEPEKIFIEGGIDQDKNIDVKVKGLRKRMTAYKIEDLVNIHISNYYESNSTEKFDFIYACNTLHRECNSHITIKNKVEKLMKAVKVGGELYIFYYLAIDEEDYVTYPKNQYLRKNEMMSYFDLSEWEVLFAKERNVLRKDKAHFRHQEEHSHKIGYLRVLRKSKKQTIEKQYYRYCYKINGLDSSIKSLLFNT